MFKLLLSLRDRRNKISLTAAIAAVLAVALALAAKWVNVVVADAAVPQIDRETVNALLDVIAASMLSVAIFSLGVLVSVFASVASGATPRATALVMDDPGTRRAIASFIAAFIFAVVSRAAVGLGYYGPAGRFVLFVATLCVMVYLIVVLLLWVRTLSSLGRMSDTLERIERAACAALQAHCRTPYLGGLPAPLLLPAGRELRPARVGLLNHIDMQALQAAAVEHGARLHLRARPGELLDPTTPMLVVEGGSFDDAGLQALSEHFVLGTARTFDQDPRFGLIVLAEVAQRSLSPAVNDPGTAIQVANTLATLIVDAARPCADKEVPSHDRVSVPALDEAALVHDAFSPIARDAAGITEVATRLQKLLHVIAANTHGALAAAARAQAALALRHAEQALPLAEERQALAALHAELFGG